MIQDLIDGIACYCNTNNQYKALENICYTFKAPVNIDNDRLSEFHPYYGKTSEYIDKALRKDRISHKDEYNNAKTKGYYMHIDDDYFLNTIQYNRDRLARKIKFQRKNGNKDDAFKSASTPVSLDDDAYDIYNKSAETSNYDNITDKIHNLNKTITNKYEENDFNFQNNKSLNNRDKSLFIGGGALGGAGLGALIGNKIAKKKGWDDRKAKVIGGLLGGVAGAGLGYGGSELYRGYKYNKARDKYITNFNNIRSNYTKSLDEVDKTIDKYKSIKRDHIKGGFYDNSELDSSIYGSYIPTWKEYKNRNK